LPGTICFCIPKAGGDLAGINYNAGLISVNI
jgi:hypothetical protein